MIKAYLCKLNITMLWFYKRMNWRYYLKNYWPSLLLVATVWYLSLFPISQPPIVEDVPFFDKWEHMLMYAVLCAVIWADYWRLHRHGSWSWLRLTVWGWLAPVLMGGLLELLQRYCTGGLRSGEWMDFFADALGATMLCLVGRLLLRPKA